MWLRDIINDLCHQRIRSAADFEWQHYPRLYIHQTQENITSQLSSVTLQQQQQQQQQQGERSEEKVQVELRCLHMRMEYGFEYMGCRPLPVFTPRMNNYIISVLQVSTPSILCRVYSPHPLFHTGYGIWSE